MTLTNHKHSARYYIFQYSTVCYVSGLFTFPPVSEALVFVCFYCIAIP